MQKKTSITVWCVAKKLVQYEDSKRTCEKRNKDVTRSLGQTI